MLDGLLSLIAPHSCCGCGKLGGLLCEVCKNDISSEPFSRCLDCLRPTEGHDLCSRCSKRLSIAAAWCVGLREGALEQLLARYKFSSASAATSVCAELLDSVLPLLPVGAVIVPVPTAPAHRRVRGFDHMQRITTCVAKRRQLPHSSLLIQHDNTTQHFKSKRERLRTAGRGLEVRGVIPETVVLVDDIYTTGATVQACVAALRQAGVRQVFVAIIARQAIDETT